MAERGKQTERAQYTVAAAVFSLAITIAVGIWRLSAMYTTVSGEHQQIFQIIKEKCK